ncbi:hypothetical protein KY289_028216 [Solanum tuberosum]|nr:hypothetical protein KY289_028216 [Solanum tuberosum]KAH0663079.1 hypothetical protein KY284_028010 [Solanum tuberosum]
MNLVNCPDVHTLHPMPSAGGSAQVNTNVSNIEKKRRHSKQAVVKRQQLNSARERSTSSFSIHMTAISQAKHISSCNPADLLYCRSRPQKDPTLISTTC